jgi:hypothetical protein
VSARLDLSIDAGDEGFQDGSRRGIRALDFALGNFRNTHRSMQQVALDILCAQDLGLAPECPPAQSIHLPQAVLRHSKTKAEIQIRR